MDLKREYRYYVVQFSDLPHTHSDIDQYVCIPDSWIRLREIADQVVVAKFPVENLSITKKRVKDGEAFSDGWSIYVAEVKYGTDSYEVAEEYIERLLQISEAPSNYSIEPVSEPLAPLAVISTEIETPKKQTNQVKIIKSVNKMTVRQENNNEKLSNVDSIENDNSPQDIAGNESPANHDGPQFTNESLDAIIISGPISDTGNPGQVKNASDFLSEEDLLLSLDHMCDAIFQCCKTLEKVMDSVNNEYYIGSYNPFNTKIGDTVAPVVEANKEREEKVIEKKRQVAKRTQAEIGIIRRRETERNEQEYDDCAGIDNNDGDDDEDDDDDDDYVKRKRFQSRTLTLPPEYDKNDSKWTVRYREYAPGLVELIKHTGVYINAVKLVNCKRLAKNSKTLARLLLVEIFTESALWTCSLTGVRAKAFDFDGTRVRPGLDENARTVLLTYVEQYAQASKWPKTDNQSILNSIRNKMQEIRFKYNK